MGVFKKKSNLPNRRRAVDVKNTSTAPHVFKRNRTLTGTTSNHLSSVGVDSDLRSPRTHVHELSTQRRKITGILLLIIFATVSLWVLLVNFTASVHLTVTNTDILKPIDEHRYTAAIQDYLGMNPFSRISFFLDQESLSTYVSSKLPEVSKVSLGGPDGFGISNYSIRLRKPIASWQIEKSQYYVDSTGVPFGINYFQPPSVKIVDNSGINIKTGTSAIASNRFLGFVGRVVALTKARAYNVTQAALPANTTRELEVRLKEAAYPIKLSIDRPAGEQVEDMVTAVSYFKKRGIKPEYLDVRVSGKAVYK